MSVEVQGGVMPVLDAAASGHVDDLVEVMRACNEATARLQRSHDRLQGEVVRLQEELAHKNDQLARSQRLAALGQMAAGIAHEVRNPLAAIQLYAGMIDDDLDPDGTTAVAEDPRVSARANAQKIASAVRGLDGIVSDVLRFARDLQPRRVVLAATAVVQRAVEAQRPLLDAVGATVDTAAVDAALELSGDPELLHQALINLLRNAAEALEDLHDDRSRGVRVEAAGAEDAVVLRLTDTGPGIPADCRARIFDPFYTTRSAGTGLGLAIVHRIIDAHGGTIAVLPAGPQGGAVFDIRLPLGSGNP